MSGHALSAAGNSELGPALNPTNNTARKQVDDMKTIIMLSLIIASLTATAVMLNELRNESQRLATAECQVNRYACFKPAVSFASLR